ncbi:MFS transporter [Peredibacter starrii]|uniref:MFS transporter n=1 Tax=Peredibacter starrii TaxID=28202 RepID=A0AAX4HU39_9BACT|nr:MFS transporter [Peredibacter starrii]WPU66731.1 MFS transporter [Peredibacter starrii]
MNSTNSLSKSMVLVLATAVGVIVANNYYAQPLISMISKALGLAPELAGLVVTLTQAGYGIGVLLIVPLGDIYESRKLTLIMIGVGIVSLLGLAFATSVVPYFLAAFATGVGASTVQILVPLAASMVPETKRGQVIGNLMSGLMVGIMLSRPTASVLSDLFHWHAVFVLSAILMALIGLLLYKVLPEKQPTNPDLKYSQLLKSMYELFKTTPVLRYRAFYQACLFGAFCLFWTASPLLLLGPEFKLSQSAVALFALVGVAGAVSAPFAGKAADKGWTKAATYVAMISCSLSFLVSHFFPAGSFVALMSLVFAAILLDAGVTANLVLGQRAVFELPAEFRSRLNGLYIALIFIGGATGSALGAWAYARGGWELTSWVGFAMPVVALLTYITEKKTN